MDSSTAEQTPKKSWQGLNFLQKKRENLKNIDLLLQRLFLHWRRIGFVGGLEEGLDGESGAAAEFLT